MNRKQRRIAAKREKTPTPGRQASDARTGNLATAVSEPPSDLMAVAVKYHQAGRLKEADACYQRLLILQPNHAEALHLRGLVAYQGGRPGSAAELIRQALQHNPQHPAYWCNLGAVLAEQTKLQAAIAAYQQAIAIMPDYAQAYSNLGLALEREGKLDKAQAAFSHAIGLQRDYAEAHYNLGNLLKLQGKLDEAEAAYLHATIIKPQYAEAYSNLGGVLAEQGKPEQALTAFRRAISIRADDAKARYNFGNVLKDQGRCDEAIAFYRQAICIKPDYAEAHSNSGAVLLDQGKLDEAMAACERAISLKPDYAEAHCNIGAILTNRGKFDEAIAACRRAIGVKPDDVETYCNLGVCLKRRGKLEEASAAYGRAISLHPDHAEAHYNLGNVLREQGKLDEAIAAYWQAIGVKPGHVQAHSNLGAVLADQGKLDEAMAAYWRAIGIQPDHVEAHSNLGTALADQRKTDEAKAAFQRAISIQPDHAEAHYNLGVVLADQGKLDEAMAAYRQAIGIKPGYAQAHSNLGNVLKEQGRLDETIVAYRSAIDVNPQHALAYSNLAYCSNFLDWTPAAELSVHRDWDKRFGRPIAMPAAHPNERQVGRRLKVGYVSPDFRGHSVAFFFEPLLQAHDRHAVEVFCYAEVARPDSVTARLKRNADHWLDTVRLSDNEVAERIRMDRIDILVDLAGHTANNRLGVFARKPAPVQVTWLGYPNTTGLHAIDYRMVDAVTDPVGEADAWATETLVRLGGCFLCYAGPGNVSEPAMPPSLTSDVVTFGSFNNPAKLSSATLDVWGRLLARLPQAHLLLKGKPFADAATRALLLSRLAERGVMAERVELVGWLPSTVSHLQHYNRVDIALDPFPYNGTTTTCEALWMGVPVVTLRGDRHRSRVSASLLSHAGLQDWIAGSIEEYIDIAVALAVDPDRLSDLRRTLRTRLATSALCDAPAFACKIEAAYHNMWQCWCETPEGTA